MRASSIREVSRTGGIAISAARQELSMSLHARELSRKDWVSLGRYVARPAICTREIGGWMEFCSSVPFTIFAPVACLSLACCTKPNQHLVGVLILRKSDPNETPMKARYS